MALTDNPRQIARRLKVDKLRAKGLTHSEIAKKLNVTRRTVIRDAVVLDEELQVEPQYSEDRIALRKELDGIYRNELLEIRRHMKMIEAGSQEFSETIRPRQKSTVKEVKDEAELLEIVKDPKQLETTQKVFGPNWLAMAAHHKAILECVRDWAKLWALMVERETEKETTIIEKETEKIIQYRELVELPVEPNKDKWQELAQKQAGGLVEIAVEPEVKPSDKRPVKNGKPAGSGS